MTNESYNEFLEIFKTKIVKKNTINILIGKHLQNIRRTWAGEDFTEQTLNVQIDCTILLFYRIKIFETAMNKNISLDIERLSEVNTYCF